MMFTGSILSKTNYKKDFFFCRRKVNSYPYFAKENLKKNLNNIAIILKLRTH